MGFEFYLFYGRERTHAVTLGTSQSFRGRLSWKLQGAIMYTFNTFPAVILAWCNFFFVMNRIIYFFLTYLLIYGHVVFDANLSLEFSNQGMKKIWGSKVFIHMSGNFISTVLPHNILLGIVYVLQLENSFNLHYIWEPGAKSQKILWYSVRTVRWIQDPN